MLRKALSAFLAACLAFSPLQAAAQTNPVRAPGAAAPAPGVFVAPGQGFGGAQSGFQAAPADLASPSISAAPGLPAVSGAAPSAPAEGLSPASEGGARPTAPAALQPAAPVLSSPDVVEDGGVLERAAPAPRVRSVLGARVSDQAGALDRLYHNGRGSTAAVPADGKAKSGDEKEPPPVPLPEPSYDYAKMFELGSRLLYFPQVRAFLRETFKEELTVSEDLQKRYGLPEKIKDVSLSQLMLLLQYSSKYWPEVEKYLKEIESLKENDPREPEVSKKWRAAFRELLKEPGLARVFAVLNDPLRPLQLRMPKDKLGFTEIKTYINHPGLADDGTEIPADDLKQAMLEFIAGAKVELMLNFFDFDLMDVADALVAKAKEGVKVTVGIDKGVIEARPEVKAVFDRLSGHKGLTVVAVDSVGLNHQKLMVRDWKDAKLARTLVSSGNLTQSCVGPEGDAVMLAEKDRPDFSVPNANDLHVVDGQAIALTVANNLTLTLDKDWRLRGREYPLWGAFKAFGPTLPGMKEPTSFVITFSPNGGVGDPNRDIIRRFILETDKPFWQKIFANSSEVVLEALIERAKLDKKAGREFAFRMVGDTPFQMREWSVGLALSGLELKVDGETKEYVPLKDIPLKDILGAQAYAEFLKNVRIGPPQYKERQVDDGKGGSIKVNAKIHHKSIGNDDMVITGSYNHSKGANSNNEQITVIRHPEVARRMKASYNWLHARSQRSVAEEAERRNALYKEKKDDEDSRDDSESRHAEEGARPKPKPSGGTPKKKGGSTAAAPRPAPVSAFRAEARRKLFHQGTLLYLAGYHALGHENAFKAAAAWTGAVGAFEALRLLSKRFGAAASRAFGGLMRPHEGSRPTGTFYTALGVAATIAFFGAHPTVVAAGILYLSLGDAASALAGRAWGKRKFTLWGRTRSLEGTLAGFAAGLVVGALLGLPAGLAFAGAAAFSVVDAVPLPPDDNLWIPLLTSAALFALGLR